MPVDSYRVSSHFPFQTSRLKFSKPLCRFSRSHFLTESSFKEQPTNTNISLSASGSWQGEYPPTFAFAGLDSLPELLRLARQRADHGLNVCV